MRPISATRSGSEFEGYNLAHGFSGFNITRATPADNPVNSAVVQIILPEELNAYDVLVNDYVVFSRASLETTVARLTGPIDSDAEPGIPASSEGDQ